MHLLRLVYRVHDLLPGKLQLNITIVEVNSGNEVDASGLVLQTFVKFKNITSLDQIIEALSDLFGAVFKAFKVELRLNKDEPGFTQIYLGCQIILVVDFLGLLKLFVYCSH